MNPFFHRMGLFFAGSWVGAVGGLLVYAIASYAARNEPRNQPDWRLYIVVPACFLGLLSAWVGDKPIQGKWSTTLSGMCVGGLIGTVGVFVVAMFVVPVLINFPDKGWAGILRFAAACIGCLVGIAIGGRVGYSHGKRNRAAQRHADSA